VRLARLLLLGALVVAGLVAVPAGDATGDDIDEARARAQEATQALADAESRLGALERDLGTAEHQA
jgi:hypothetical protein